MAYAVIIYNLPYKSEQLNNEVNIQNLLGIKRKRSFHERLRIFICTIPISFDFRINTDF